MQLSVLQLNINADNFWSKLIAYLQHNDFDIIQLQEVSGMGTLCGNINCTHDCFADLQTVLADKYNGELAIAGRFTSSPTAYMGNALFYKRQFSLVDKREVFLYQRPDPFPSDSKTYEDQSRSLLHLTLAVNDKPISFLTMHGAWAHTSKEEPHQTIQADKLINYLKTVPPPFVFSGDLNLDPQQQTIHKINQLARNLTVENHVATTLNPRTHRARELFPPGIAVDYVFTSWDLKVVDFKVIEEDISDHFGLTAIIEV